MNREVNKSVCLNTIKCTQEILKYYPKELTDSRDNTIKYDVTTIPNSAPNIFSAQLAPHLENKEQVTQVILYNNDTLDTSYILKKEGLNPVVLNMASDYKPGGGWRSGSSAQEESIFYRSTYHYALQKHFYPLKTFESIYSPNIFIFKNRNYSLLSPENCFFLSFIAMPAIRNPALINGKYSKEDESIMREKIRGIFKIALLHKHDSIVLGPLGCGAFNNPPEEVSKIFKEVIAEYRNNFKKIVFAILDFNGSDNYNIFKNCLT